jgi:hypothetical protein
MVKTIERILRRLLPELFAGYHLPMLAKVLAVADAPATPGIADEFRPRYAVDIQILKANGKINQSLPVYKSVPLPCLMAGLDQGMWGFPQAGTVVEVAFAYGNPNKPFIRTILSTDATTPAVDNGDMVWQHSPGINQTADTAGNWTRHTDKAIEDQSTTRLVKAIQDVQQYQHQTIEVAANSTETTGGTKSLEAMGALKIAAGEQGMFVALKELKLASNELLKLYSKDNTELTTDADLQVLAANIAHIEAAQVWLGSADVNAVQILVDLIGVVSDLANTLKSHTHPHGVPNTAAPIQASAIDGHKSDADALKSSLEPITE